MCDLVERLGFFGHQVTGATFYESSEFARGWVEKTAMNSGSEILAEFISCRTLIKASDSGLPFIGTERAESVTVADTGPLAVAILFEPLESADSGAECFPVQGHHKR
jgi:hypothetical protein